MLVDQLLTKQEPLREAITMAYRRNETECVESLLQALHFSPSALSQIQETARKLLIETRAQRKKQSGFDALLQHYDLSSEEGIALLCLAEALLRIPDQATQDLLISDKISSVNWFNHLKTENSLFSKATAWSLMLAGKIFSPTQEKEHSFLSTLKKTLSHPGIAALRPLVMQGMKMLSTTFVLGSQIEEALKNAQTAEALGYRFSYDMLGEAARTAEDAKRYFESYRQAIKAIGEAQKLHDPIQGAGLSIKLSALHPRYEYSKQAEVMKELTPQLVELLQLAKKYNMGVTIDAEEADRLDLSLDIFESLFASPELSSWEGLGIVVQAYQKRAPFVIDWLAALSKKYQKRILLRLVKGAYWDSEIKQSQVLGLEAYPVFTRKHSTDLSYLVCAKKLLDQPSCFYAQFGTHNAQSIAAILEMAGSKNHFEFQCLHGMGRTLYDQIVDRAGYNIPTRIYAPVGKHQDLVGYLVRRLLENGANTSFISQLGNEQIPIEKVIA
ncbi:MAG TPA: proline dehydrogenase family protein, partial [Gammaproteobacteria bacterium]|nr:proline dehydrogenase family protein [Gammaproteobacteria bacterium]